MLKTSQMPIIFLFLIDTQDAQTPFWLKNPNSIDFDLLHETNYTLCGNLTTTVNLLSSKSLTKYAPQNQIHILYLIPFTLINNKENTQIL